ncbi:armadillo-type protein [Mycena vulgaris]|nr:armadillo-type protein [Mycena vulgaris]
MLAELARTLVALGLEVELCKKLVPFLRDDNIVVVESALYALSLLINWPEGAQDPVDANLLGSIAKPLTSPSSDVQRWMCWFLGQLAVQETTSAAVIGGICKHLAQFLQLTDLVSVSAVSALVRISEHPGGITAIVDAGIQTYILNMPESSDLEIRVHSHILQRNLCHYNLGRSHSTVIQTS